MSMGVSVCMYVCLCTTFLPGADKGQERMQLQRYRHVGAWNQAWIL